MLPCLGLKGVGIVASVLPKCCAAMDPRDQTHTLFPPPPGCDHMVAVAMPGTALCGRVFVGNVRTDMEAAV